MKILRINEKPWSTPIIGFSLVFCSLSAAALGPMRLSSRQWRTSASHCLQALRENKRRRSTDKIHSALPVDLQGSIRKNDDVSLVISTRIRRKRERKNGRRTMKSQKNPAQDERRDEQGEENHVYPIDDISVWSFDVLWLARSVLSIFRSEVFSSSTSRSERWNRFER